MDQRLRLSIDSLREGVQLVDRAWRYVYVNRAASQHVRQPPEALIGRTMTECHPGIEQTELFRALERVVRTGQPETFRNELTYPSGEQRWFDLLIEPVPDGLCILSLDITERVRAEDEARHMQRMDIIGRLAGGVAHDFNNQLTAMLGFTDLLLERDPPLDDRADLEAIRAAAARSASLTQQLLIFSRRQRLTIVPTNINIVVESVARLLQRALGAHVRFTVHLSADVPPILGDAQQLENALTNLAINARDAMTAGGLLRIETGSLDLREEDIRQHPSMKSGRYAVLSVSDTGHGMDEATKARIFEPFFTTKPAGHGTGLGLSLVYGLVKQMGGFIWVYSEPGSGATFRLYFPVTTDAPAPAAPPPVRRVAAGRATILVVEDDIGVRTFVARTLTLHGHRVFAATTVQDARLQMQAIGAPPDLVITDIVLPGGSGPKLLADLPLGAAKVLFMSGYSHEQLEHHGLRGPVRLLAKPFTVAGLLGAVDEVLSAERPDASHPRQP